MIREEVWKAALAGLLHDIGKFAQRAGVSIKTQFTKEDVGEHGYHALYSQFFVEEYVPRSLREKLGGVLYHHRHDLRNLDVDRIQIADQVAAGERRIGSEEQADPRQARLIPILSNVFLTKKPVRNKKHSLIPLSVEDTSAYPVEDIRGDYQELWAQLKAEIENWQKSCGDIWDNLPIEIYFPTLLALFQKYLWCVPSATPWQKGESQWRAYPDVSLYDHNRLTSAIAACLAYDGKLPQSEEEPVALLVRGDVSGIQGFIYRLQRPDSETAHIAKRLRGRSFYLQLLTDLIVDTLLCEIGVPDSCVIFVGGGRFDLLLPLQAQEIVLKFSHRLSEWLFETFMGELGVLIVAEPARRSDFADARQLYQKLDEKLELAKQRKWAEVLLIENMALPQGEIWHVCKVCQLTPMEDSGQVCAFCQDHELIGKKLPFTNYLAYCYTEPRTRVDFISLPEQSPLVARYIVFATHRSELEQLPQGTKIIKLNQNTDFILHQYPSSFRFIANFAPIAREDWEGEGEEKVEKGKLLHFDAIAKLSNGAERIGVLKADVDLLGLVMSEGLIEEGEEKASPLSMKPTLSRLAALSRMLDLFFAGNLNRICRELSEEWAIKNQGLANKAEGIFYILYSGGDDLFVVGPWDWTLRLAERIRDEFGAYTGNNPNLTLSAGYIQIKPRYPIQKAAELVDEAEKAAKRERNQICAFNVLMTWEEFKAFLKRSKEWSQAVAQKEIPAGFIYDLASLFRQHSDAEGKLRPLWTPQLYYTIARRLKKEVKEKYQQGIFEAIQSRKVLFPVSITSLTIRERSK